MEPITVRLHFLDADGYVVDGRRNYPLSQFGGVLPAVGDMILDPEPISPGVAMRMMLTIVRRVFNPRDLESYVALVCERRPVSVEETTLVPDLEPVERPLPKCGQTVAAAP